MVYWSALFVCLHSLKMCWSPSPTADFPKFSADLQISSKLLLNRCYEPTGGLLQTPKPGLKAPFQRPPLVSLVPNPVSQT